jgi:hypothetical protein
MGGAGFVVAKMRCKSVELPNPMQLSSGVVKVSLVVVQWLAQDYHRLLSLSTTF